VSCPPPEILGVCSGWTKARRPLAQHPSFPRPILPAVCLIRLLAASTTTRLSRRTRRPGRVTLRQSHRPPIIYIHNLLRPTASRRSRLLIIPHAITSPHINSDISQSGACNSRLVLLCCPTFLASGDGSISGNDSKLPAAQLSTRELCKSHSCSDATSDYTASFNTDLPRRAYLLHLHEHIRSYPL
jgi:hypothetical protein